MTDTPQAAHLDDHLGAEMVEMTPTKVVSRLTIDSRHHQPYGIVHGGVYCVMAESAASLGGVMAVREMTGNDDAGAVGQSNHTDFLKATRSGTITATATPVHVGRSVQLWDVDITDDEGSRVATSRVRLFNVGVDRMSEG